jgi:hypothetical protein
MAQRSTFTVYTHPSIRRVIRSASLARRAIDIAVTGVLVLAAFLTIGAALLAIGVWWFFLRKQPPRPEMIVGSDGLRFIEGTKDAFVPWTRVSDVEEHDQGVRIRLTSGWPVQAFVGLGESDPKTVDVAHKAARAFRLAKKKSADLTPLASRLARGRRTVDEWLAAIGDVDPRGAGYRDAPIGERDLWEVAEHPGASVDARAAACVLLARLGQDGTAERIEALSESTAQPKLEDALDLVLEDERGALAAAIA